MLFDLDDTLSDHRGASRLTLKALQERWPVLAAVPLPVLIEQHQHHLETIHGQVLTGNLTLADARVERFRRLFQDYHVTLTPAAAEEAAAFYRRAYQGFRRPVAGAAALLERLAPIVTVGIITNNLTVEQEDKLRVCGLEPFVDFMLTSEDAGVSKPDPSIFRQALAAARCEPFEAVMIGDSWPQDVLGARSAGIRAVWFNRQGACSPDRAVPVIRTLDPVPAAVQILLHGPADAD